MRSIYLILVCVLLATAGCKHPLEITGQGDIIDRNGSGHGCTLEQFEAGDEACTENEVTEAYLVNYHSIPRAGWRFDHWTGPCGQQSVAPDCEIMAAAGLAQNLAALRALVTDGIQRGHMSLHQRRQKAEHEH